MGLLHSIATQWPNPSLFLEHSPQLSAKSPLCIGEWNMQQFNMDFTCHAVYPECTSAARIWVRRCQKISVGKIWGEARDSVYVFLNIMVSALGCHQSKSSWIFAKKSCIYIYICIRMFDFWATKNSLALTLSPSLIGKLCMWHSQDGPLLAVGPWGSSVALVLHLMPFESGRCWYENYIPKKTKPHARMRIWYSILSYSATTGLSATFFASFFQPIQIQ